MTEAPVDGNGDKQRINQLVEQFDTRLRQEFGEELFEAGWCLLLGKYYGQSPIVYFSLNPGIPRSRGKVDLTSRDEWNVPFKNPPELQREFAYLQNCQRFFESDTDLNEWIQDRVTSAFLIPWRTRNWIELAKLNAGTGGRLWAYGREIAKTVLEDHKARMILAVGKTAVELLIEMKVVSAASRRTAVLGPGGTYQWSRWEAEANGRKVDILQIPHFSRANSPAKMSDFARWLREQVAGFARQR